MPELERITSVQYGKIHSEGLVLVLDNIRSAHNVGSIFRTSDCFGVSKIYLCGITCKTDNRELQKTALGAEISVPSTYCSSTMDAVNDLKAGGYTIIALEQTKDSQILRNTSFDKSRKYAFVLGNEVEGVAENVLSICDGTIEIPQVGAKHSLNVSNASSILIWEYFKQICHDY